MRFSAYIQAILTELLRSLSQNLKMDDDHFKIHHSQASSH
jgi:hypothetical protein